MDDKELELRKEVQRQKIREIRQNAQLKSLESQLKTEKEANKHFEELERTLKEIQQVVDSWDRKYENTPKDGISLRKSL
ncbi:hypothetical protein [Enterococcus sp. UD-01]|jgi:hypothetical protein|uniref:hypothetical protein n=1 Tax=Enterococcus sp. UD-01 TaxID=3373911 RepID=UPI003837EBAD